MTLLTSTESVLLVQEFSPLMTPNCLKEVAKIGSDVCIYVCDLVKVDMYVNIIYILVLYVQYNHHYS